MSSIQSTSQLAAIIRSQIESLGKVTTKKTPEGKLKNLKSGDTSKKQDLADLISLRVSEIQEEDPDRVSKAFRIFLESVLLSELGPRLIRDPRFFQMIDAIQAQMLGDNELSSQIEKAMLILLSGHKRKIWRTILCN